MKKILLSSLACASLVLAELKQKDNLLKVSEAIEKDDFYVDDTKITDYRRKLRDEGQKIGLYNFELSRQKFELEPRKWSIGI
jgi:protein-disulfide isomerase-like protein with CxxC motif